MTKNDREVGPALKGLAVAVALALVAAALWMGYEQRIKHEGPPPVGYRLLEKFEREGVPDFEALKVGGGSAKLSDARGKVIILSFWASWCGPCVQEFPSLIKMIEHFKGEVVLVGVSADQTQEEVTAFVKLYLPKQPIAFMNLWDPATRIANDFGTVQIPENYIIGKDFKLVRKLASSENWMRPDVLGFLEAQIKK